MKSPPRRPAVAATTASFFLTASAVALVPAAGRAQTPPPFPPPVRPSRPGRPAGATSYQAPTLQPLLNKVTWDAGERGPLLIVAPDKATPIWNRGRAFALGGFTTYNRNGEIVTQNGVAAPKMPAPDASGKYRLADLGEYFGRRVVRVGGLTVFAPATMTVLATRLPEPDPYAGMGPNEKLRLFQSVLTPAQWRKLGGADGIGVGDLDREQRALFLSLLPDPFVVQPVKRGDNGDRIVYLQLGGNEKVTLTPTQREGVRLTMRRTLDWRFTRTDASNSGFRIGAGNDDDGADYEISGNGLGSNFTGGDGEVFGLRLLEDVPSRAKLSQLAFDAPALDAPVPLGGAATVGELVKRVQTQTRLELFCDPRYADLAVYTRSSGSVRAGDLLNALCRGVTGTFRKVGASSWVMTDDMEGLGTRHARLQAWAQASAALFQKRQEAVNDALAKTPIGDYVDWASGDASRPGAALAQKIEDYRRTMNDAKAPALLLVPVSELPAAAQEKVRRQKESFIKSQEQQRTIPAFASRPDPFPVSRMDRVAVDVQVRTSFVLPGGIGLVSAQGSSYSGDTVQSLTAGERMKLIRAAAMSIVTPGSVALPSVFATRALLVKPQNADEATRAVAAAKAHGLNQVWIEVPPTTDSGGKNAADAPLVAAITAGKAASVSIGAVVRLLRAPHAAATESTSLSLDRNIVGETATEYAARRAKALAVAPPDQETELLFEEGDWLPPNEPATQAAPLKRASAVAQTPGLSGIILRDVAAPGYDSDEATANLFDFPDGTEQMGYTEPMRLAFLRESGIDPVDLSLLHYGSRPEPLRSLFMSFNAMQLPFFPDYGSSPGGMSINRQRATELGAKDGADRWARFRKAQSDALTDAVVKTAIHSASPTIPVWIQRRSGSFSASAFASFFDKWGSAEAPPSPQQPTRSPNALLTIRYAPLPHKATTTAGNPAVSPDPANDFTRRLASLMTGVPPGWGGVVLDLSDADLERALPLLEVLKP